MGAAVGVREGEQVIIRDDRSVLSLVIAWQGSCSLGLVILSGVVDGQA